MIYAGFPMLAWLKIKDNREALGVALAVVTTLAGGGWFVYEQFLKPKSPSKPSAAIIVEGDQTGTINNDTGDGPRITMAIIPR